MLTIYRTDHGVCRKLKKPEAGCWICLTSPTSHELDDVSLHYDVDPADLRAALDEEEASRIELEDDYTLILVDVPIVERRNDEEAYTTIPLGIILVRELLITVCSDDVPILADFAVNKVKQFSTKKRMRFVYQILFRTASTYQRILRVIDKRRVDIESRFDESSTEINDMIALHELETTLVYFETSLRGNEVVLNRLSLYKRIDQFPEDTELLDDVIIENKQAIEMAVIYKDVISGTRELLSTIEDSRLNNAMKFLTSITLVMAIPTIVSGFYGMNVPLPLSKWAHSFSFLTILTIAVCVIVLLILKKKHML
jgi:magnesium transporter